MKKLAIAFCALTLATFAASSQASISKPFQARCSLSEATAPSVRGLKLGMSTQQLLALFPGSSKRKEMRDAIDRAKSATGVEAAYLVFDAATDGDPKIFEGVESVSVALYQARLMDFTLQYANATWPSIDSWITKLSETLKLPGPQGWTMGPNEAPNKILRCDGVMIEAVMQGGGASVRVANSTLLKEMDDRAKAAEEKRRREMKP